VVKLRRATRPRIWRKQFHSLLVFVVRQHQMEILVTKTGNHALRWDRRELPTMQETALIGPLVPNALLPLRTG
jgi:hypothetical protein